MNLGAPSGSLETLGQALEVAVRSSGQSGPSQPCDHLPETQVLEVAAQHTAVQDRKLAPMRLGIYGFGAAAAQAPAESATRHWTTVIERSE